MPEIRKAADGRERRFISAATTNVGTRAADDDAPVVEGSGALFNVEAVIYGMFREVILPGAFKDSLANDDIRVAFNHSPHFIIGRTSAKTAKVWEDGEGLKYRAEPPDTTWARDMVTSIKRRDITGSSFQFEVENDEDEEWDYSETKKGMLPLRKIKRAKLWENGPVAYPAYESTTVSARAIGKAEEPLAGAAAASDADQAAAAEAEARAAADAQDTVAQLENELLMLDTELLEIE